MNGLPHERPPASGSLHSQADKSAKAFTIGLVFLFMVYSCEYSSGFRTLDLNLEFVRGGFSLQ